jgi:hypothetical protein
MSKNKAKSVEEFDRRFDEGESIFELAEVKSVSRPNLEPQRINVDVPKHFLQQLDQEAALRGISRQALIKTWLYERLELRSLNVQRLSENVWSEGMSRYYVERPRGSGRITELIVPAPLETSKD